MKDLQDATERICELKGSLVAIETLVTALLQAVPATARDELRRTFEGHVEVARTVMLHAPTSELTPGAFERDTGRLQALIGRS